MACSIKLLSMPAPSSVGSLVASIILLDIVVRNVGSILMCDDPNYHPVVRRFGEAHFGEDKYEPNP